MFEEKVMSHIDKHLSLHLSLCPGLLWVYEVIMTLEWQKQKLSILTVEFLYWV